MSACPSCRGHDPDCKACDGTGKKEWTRCPTSQVTPDVWALLESYAAFDRSNALPCEGGWLDQARLWARWVAMIDGERARIEEENRPKKKAPRVKQEAE